MKPLRIAFFVTYFPKLSEIFILNQARALVERGHQVHFYALTTGGEQMMQPGVQPFFDRGAAHVGEMPRQAPARIINALMLIPRLGVRATMRALDFWRDGIEAASLRNFYRLHSLSNLTVDCDIIHAQFGNVARQCIFLKRMGRLKQPLVTAFRGNDLSGYLRHARTGLYQPVFEVSRACLPVSRRWVDVLGGMGCPRDKIHVIPSGIPMDAIPRREKYVTDEKAFPRIVSAGRLDRYKGVRYGLAAFRQILAAYPHAEYDILGEGPDKEYLQRLSHNWGVHQRVRLHGHTTHDQVLSTFQKAHLHLFTTVTERTGRTEGVPNVLKESQAAGVPAVAFDHPGVDEVVRHDVTGFLVDERDSSAMAARAIELLSNPPLAQSMSLAAQEYTRNTFDLNNLTRQLEEIYYAVI